MEPMVPCCPGKRPVQSRFLRTKLDLALRTCTTGRDAHLSFNWPLRRLSSRTNGRRIISRDTGITYPNHVSRVVLARLGLQGISKEQVEDRGRAQTGEAILSFVRISERQL